MFFSGCVFFLTIILVLELQISYFFVMIVEYLKSAWWRLLLRRRVSPAMMSRVTFGSLLNISVL